MACLFVFQTCSDVMSCRMSDGTTCEWIRNSGLPFSVLSRLRFDTMRATHLPSLADVAADAAAGSIITDYLTARGVRTVPTLAFIAKTEEELDRRLIQPLFAGYTQGTQRFEVPNQEQPIIQAILLHMWNTCKQLWATHATPPPSSTPPATTTPSASTTKPEEKVPKQLPTGVWSTAPGLQQGPAPWGRSQLPSTRDLGGGSDPSQDVARASDKPHVFPGLAGGYHPTPLLHCKR